MKTTRFTLLATLLVMSNLFVGCKKEEDYKPCSEQGHGIIKPKNCPPIIFGVDLDLPLNTQNVSNLLVKKGDPDGEKINYQLYYLSHAIQDLVQNSEFNHAIIDLAKSSYNQTADLNKLLTNNPEFKGIIDQNLALYGTSFQEIYDNMTRVSPERKTFEKYKPVIFIPNLDNINPDKQPIFSPNIEVDCTYDGSIEDNIVAWYYTESGEKVEVMLSEDNSLVLTNPLFLLDNGEIDPKPKPNSINNYRSRFEEKKEEDNNSMNTTTYYSIHEFNLYHYFEPIGKPEFTIVAYRIDEEISHDNIHRIYYPYCGYGDEVDSGCKILRKVDRSEICTQVEYWCLLFPRFTNTAAHIIVYNTFERDWNRSEKPLGHLTGGSNNTNHIYLYGHMQYNSDWYGIDPANFTWADVFDQTYIYNYWAKWYYFTNSNMRAWRVEL
jgi:hypothetical protein